MMSNEYRLGSCAMRDNVIAMCIGFQNEQGNKEDSEDYKAYQKIIDALESQYGRFMSK